jgi:hypothetical protein
MSWCMYCCLALHPTMLTGYCLTRCKCDNCGRTADLAMVKPKMSTEEKQ